MKQVAPCSRNSLEKIARIFSALSEPTRLAILRALKDQEMTVNELVAAIGTSQPNISKHLHLLYDAGLLRRKEVGTYVLYRLADDLPLRLCQQVCDRLNQEAQAALQTYSV